jgi:hypothetical protein
MHRFFIFSAVAECGAVSLRVPKELFRSCLIRLFCTAVAKTLELTTDVSVEVASCAAAVAAVDLDQLRQNIVSLAHQAGVVLDAAQVTTSITTCILDGVGNRRLAIRVFIDEVDGDDAAAVGNTICFRGRFVARSRQCIGGASS